MTSTQLGAPIQASNPSARSSHQTPSFRFTIHAVTELLANVNPTFTWVRLAQRIPVRIRLTDVPADVLISAGMTCTVVLKEGAEPHIGAGIKRLMAAIFELIERGRARRGCVVGDAAAMLSTLP
jgi:hypothetical protein